MTEPEQPEKNKRPGEIANRQGAASEERQGRVARAYLRGESVEEIAKRERIDRSTVYRDVKRAREAWRENAGNEYELNLGEKVAQLRHVQWEAWKAWEKSKRMGLRFSHTDGTAAGENGGEYSSSTTQKERSNGNPAFLTQVRNALKIEAQLLGLLDKDREGPAEDMPKPVEIVISTREEAEQIISFEEFRKGVAAAEANQRSTAAG